MVEFSLCGIELDDHEALAIKLEKLEHKHPSIGDIMLHPEGDGAMDCTATYFIAESCHLFSKSAREAYLVHGDAAINEFVFFLTIEPLTRKVTYAAMIKNS